MENVCHFCLKEFSTKINLVRHQSTTKSCLKLQGKTEITIECVNCKKSLVVEYYKQHKIKCDSEYSEKNKYFNDLSDKHKIAEKNNKKLKTELSESKDTNEKINITVKELKASLVLMEKENEKLQSIITVLRDQNEKLHSSSTSVTMRLVEKANTVNNTNNTVVIHTNQLTNDVLRHCASTFTMLNAYNIKGIAKHLTSSLEEHITCTDPSRNIFKYTNEKDEEIVDQNLEILIPQYLTAVKDRNDFLYKEVFDYFRTNNVSLSVQTDYRVFYNALNSIIEKTGQQNKYTEKCKQHMVKECKRQFLEKNKNKEKMIAKALTVDEVMMNVIETGGSVHDFVDRFFIDYNMDDETDDQFTYRREMEDLFRVKKRAWKDAKKHDD
jgi:hypothetical protein